MARPTQGGSVRKRPAPTPKARGPQGLPTASGHPSPQPRPAPAVQPGPIRGTERQVIRRAVQSPDYQRKLKATHRENVRSRLPRGALDARQVLDTSPNTAPAPHHSLLHQVLKGAERAVVQASPFAPAQDVQNALPPSTRRTVDRELAGRGVLAATLLDLAKRARPVPIDAGPGLGAVHAASGGRIGPPLAAAAPITPHLRDAGFLGRAAEDLINFPAQAPASVYQPVAGVVEAAQGHPQRLHDVLKGVQKDDPIYALATGNLKNFGRIASAHPGFTALELYGAKGAIGRGAGRAVRGAGRVTGNSRVYDYASTRGRADAVVEHTNIRKARPYSPDLMTKRAQVKADAVRTAKAAKLREQARQITDQNSAQAKELRRRANRMDPVSLSDKQVKGQWDKYEGQANSLLMRERAKVHHEALKIVKGAKDKGAALSVVAQGIAKADPADLRAYRDELAGEYGRMTDPAQKAANQALRQALDVSLKDATPEKMARVAHAAAEYAKRIDKPLDDEMVRTKLISRDRANRSKLISYAAREMGAKVIKHDVSDGNGGTVARTHLAVDDGQGGMRFLPNSEIRAHMRANGVDPKAVSYVSQKPTAAGAGNFYRNQYEEPAVSGARRTERATLQGTFDSSSEAMVARAANAQNMVTTAKNFRHMIGRGLARDRKGDTIFSRRTDAANLARSLTQDTGREYGVVRVHPMGIDAEHLQGMFEDMGQGLQDDPRYVKEFREGMQNALDGKGADGPFGVAPRAMIDSMQAHLKKLNPGDTERLVRSARRSWSRAVLGLSPGPTVGNIIEAGVVRTPLARAGILSHKTAAAAARANPEGFAAVMDMLGAGDRVSLAVSKRHMDPSQFLEGWQRRAVEVAQGLERSKVGKGPVAAWHLWQHAVFDWANGAVQRFFLKGLAGKAIRDSANLFDDKMPRLMSAAMQDAYKGLSDTKNQLDAAQTVFDSYGKYSGYSPGVQRLIAEYTPFLAWFLSSVRFIYRVMPRDHPLATALIAASEQATQDYRKAHGMDIFQGGAGRLPGFLQGTVPGLGGFVKLAYNTPFGAMTDPGRNSIGLVLPEFQTLQSALLYGQDWKGKKLRNPDGSDYDFGQQAIYGVGETLSSAIPFLAVPKAIGRYGKDPSKLLNPVRVKVRGDSSSSSSSGGGGGGGQPIDPLLQARIEAAQRGGVATDPDLLKARIAAARGR